MVSQCPSTGIAQRRKRGFTLVELLITISVAAILLALAVPSFSSMIASYRLTTFTNELIQAINLTRSEAIKRNRSMALCRSEATDATACAGAPGTWNNWIVLAGAADVVRRNSRNEPGSAIRVNSSFATERITFVPDGTAQDTGTLTVCSALDITENRRDIEIGPGNRIATIRSGGACP